MGVNEQNSNHLGHHIVFPSVKEGADERTCKLWRACDGTVHEMSACYCCLEAKHILTGERFGYYCMKIPKAISPICNCNKEGKKKARLEYHHTIQV